MKDSFLVIHKSKVQKYSPTVNYGPEWMLSKIKINESEKYQEF